MRTLSIPYNVSISSVPKTRGKPNLEVLEPDIGRSACAEQRDEPFGSQVAVDVSVTTSGESAEKLICGDGYSACDCRKRHTQGGMAGEKT